MYYNLFILFILITYPVSLKYTKLNIFIKHYLKNNI